MGELPLPQTRVSDSSPAHAIDSFMEADESQPESELQQHAVLSDVEMNGLTQPPLMFEDNEFSSSHSDEKTEHQIQNAPSSLHTNGNHLMHQSTNLSKMSSSASSLSHLSSDDVVNSDDCLDIHDKYLERIKAVHTRLLSTDRMWSIIDSFWYRRWSQYAHFDLNTNSFFDATPECTLAEKRNRPFPGPIDNKSLVAFEDSTQLKNNLDPHQYIIVAREVSDILYETFHGGPQLIRPAIQRSRSVKLELFPTEIHAFSTKDSNVHHIFSKYFSSKQDTLNDVVSYWKSLYDFSISQQNDAADIHLWMAPLSDATCSSAQMLVSNHNDSTTYNIQKNVVVAGEVHAEGLKWRKIRHARMTQPLYELKWPSSVLIRIEYFTDSLQDIAVFPDVVVGDLFEVNQNGTWELMRVVYISSDTVHFRHRACSRSDIEIDIHDFQERVAEPGTHLAKRYAGFRQYRDETGLPTVDGAVGLSNLGNTCFMNSILSSLMHAPKLTEYFLSNKYIDDINRDNPLGWNGEVAESYASLVHEFWSGQFKTVAPRRFKNTIAEVQPRFSGYQQQDSQELLQFLLDGLHEDLNRVKQKPVTSVVESDGRPDVEVATEAWEVFLMRNRSVIVDLFYGQCKSRIVCPEPSCNKNSITFDSVACIQLPLSTKNEIVRQFLFVSSMSIVSSITKYGCKMDRLGNMSCLLNFIVSERDLPYQELVLYELWNGKIYKFIAPETLVADVSEFDDIICYHVPSLAQNSLLVPVLNFSLASHQVFGLPLLRAISANKSVQIQQLALDVLHSLKAEEKIYKPNIPGASSLSPGSQPINKLSTTIISMQPEERIVTANNVSVDNYPGDMNANSESIAPASRLRSENAHVRILLSDSNATHCLNCKQTFINCECESLHTTQYATNSFTFTSISQFDNAGDLRSEQCIVCVWPSQDDYDEPQQQEHFSVHQKIAKSESLSLQSCFDAFTAEEILDEDNSWYCSNCKKHQQAHKKLDLYKLPPLLVIQLKRFQYTRTRRDKINVNVEYPLEGLDLTGYVDDPEAIYDLFAVSNHSGGLGGGHYTSYVKNLVTGEWYEHDDSRVCKVSVDEIVSPASYILMYRKQTVRSESLPPASQQIVYPSPLSNNTYGFGSVFSSGANPHFPGTPKIYSRTSAFSDVD